MMLSVPVPFPRDYRRPSSSQLSSSHRIPECRKHSKELQRKEEEQAGLVLFSFSWSGLNAKINAMQQHHQHSEPDALVILIFVPIYLSAAVMLTCTLLLRNPRRRQRSRSVLPAGEERHWWQFLWWRQDGRMKWSDPTRSDKEKGLVEGAPPPSQAYGTFAVSDGVHPAITKLDFAHRSDIAVSPTDPKHTNSSPNEPLPNTILSRPGKLEPRPEGFEDDYELIRTLKDNSEGPIHLVKARGNPGEPKGGIFIIKQLRARMCRGKAMWPHEANMLARQLWPELRHPNIVKLHHVHLDIFTNPVDPVCNLVLEFCSDGDLWNFANALADQGEKRGALKMFVAHVLASMIDALSYLHWGKWYDADAGRMIRNPDQEAILHRDVKMMNIFLRWDDKSRYGLPTPVLGDFGMATTAKDNTGHLGTPSHWAPEIQEVNARAMIDPDFRATIARRRIHTPATDMYALGMLLFELAVAGKSSVLDMTTIQTKLESSNCARDQSIESVIKGCLDENPRRRPNAAELWNVSKALKLKLQRWYEEGNRLPASIWPDAFRFEDGPSSPIAAPPGSSQCTIPSPVSSAESAILEQINYLYGTMDPHNPHFAGLDETRGASDTSSSFKSSVESMIPPISVAWSELLPDDPALQCDPRRTKSATACAE